MDKIERYNWAKPGDRGKACRLSVDELLIDLSYQRGEVSDKNTLGIASAFSWVAFGTLVVMERSDGSRYVVDGQQRLCAAKRRGETTVPCQLFSSDGPKHEARAFLSLNTRRIRVSAVDKFNAAAKAGNDPEALIAKWLTGIGLSVMADGRSMSGVCFPSVLLDSWKVESETAKRAIELQRLINGDTPLCGDVHKGICWLLWNGIEVGQEVNKLSQAGGRIAMLRSIKSLELALVQRASYRTCGIGILKLINYKRRKKIPVPENGLESY